MNIANITDELKDAYIRIYKEDHPNRVHKDAAAIPTVPMLTYDFGNETDDQIRDRVNASFQSTTTVPQMPFDSFRYWMRFPNSIFYGICGRYSDKELIAFGVGISRTTGQRLLIRANIEPPTKPGEICFKARVWDSQFKEMDVAELRPSSRRALDWLIGTLSLGLEQMAYEYLRPDQHVATVTPDKAGKSIEWIRARTHYTIVHRKHAANTKGITKGAIVKQDEDKHLQRIAHTRRAHWRTFRSERFKKVRGERRFIKSMWVGPEEWRDGAGQVYRIAALKPKPRAVVTDSGT